MAGKRPDQHNIDPREAGATDYKNLPQQGHHGGSSLDDTVELDRRRMGEQEEELRAAGAMMPHKPAPSRYAREGVPLTEAGHEEIGSEEGREREAHGTEDPRSRGVGG